MTHVQQLREIAKHLNHEPDQQSDILRVAYELEQQGEPITVEAVATVEAAPGPEFGARLDWLVEGGLDSLPTGVVLLVAHRPITDDDGKGTVYTKLAKDIQP